MMGDAVTVAVLEQIRIGRRGHSNGKQEQRWEGQLGRAIGEYMHLGSTYLIAKDFEKSLAFYEKLLQMKVSAQNMTRFAMFEFEGHCIAIMNAYFDTQNPDKVVYKGGFDSYFDDLPGIAESNNTRKMVLNFWVEDLREEYKRMKELNISDRLTGIKYVCNVSPYYYFQLTDPDGNVIEITGAYTE